MDEEKTIEEWKETLGTKLHIFMGLKAKNGYSEGKKVSKEAYEKALNLFLYGENTVRPEVTEGIKRVRGKKDE
jgi:hypothetical protein